MSIILDKSLVGESKHYPMLQKSLSCHDYPCIPFSPKTNYEELSQGFP